MDGDKPLNLRSWNSPAKVMGPLCCHTEKFSLVLMQACCCRGLGLDEVHAASFAKK